MLRDFLRRLVENSPRSRRRPRPGGLAERCGLEQLEDRCLLSANVAGAVAGHALGGEQGPPQILPAVQKVDEAAARTQEVADLRNPADEHALIGLLLPAIQKVRDAAARAPNPGDVTGPPNDDFVLPALQKVRDADALAQREGELPAVQKVQEAADRLEGIGDVTAPPNDADQQTDIGTTGVPDDDFVLPALQKVRDAAALAQREGELPAVQKVQEAADRLEGIGDVTSPPNDADQQTDIGTTGVPDDDFVLPALQKVRDAAALAQREGELPAVQKVQEAADRLEGIGDPTAPPNDDFVLPALQKVRDAADRTQEVADLKNPSEHARIGMLLPAIQKVR